MKKALAVSMGRRNTLRKYICWCDPVEVTRCVSLEIVEGS